MMLHHIYSADKQRRMAKLFKRARLNRASSVALLVAVPTAQAPPHHGDEGMGVSDTVLSAPVSDLTASLYKELVEIGRHFSKIASRFAFDNDAASYNAWVIQFKAEAENCGLDDTLTDARRDTPLATLRQKTAYHMILSCVPKTVLVSVTSNLREHTAYEAWSTLRRHYIGDEATYLQGLETRFNRATWSDVEDFPAFEIRFNQVVAELEAAGQAKSDHVKKSVFLHAIESSSKKDVRGAHVFDRLNTTSKIHFQTSFTEWMVHMRVEAQHIRDAVIAESTRRGSTKRAHDNAASDATHSEVVPVSFVNMPPANSRPPPFRAMRRTTGPCFNMQATGSCKFGAQCRFSHEPSQLRSADPRAASSPAKSSEACRNFLAGRCNRGDTCRFSHASTNSNGGSRHVDAKSEDMPHLLRSVSSSSPTSTENTEYMPRF
jgi:hypothetical protein